MVDALVSGASAERRVGSSPILGTRSSLNSFFVPRIGLGQSVAFWVTNLRATVVCCRKSLSL